MMFTTFTDRDGKYQLLSLAESAFDPLSRTCRFMLTEEAHHMFVGQTGIARIAQRTAELVRQGKDPRKEGAIPFDVLQRYLNFWYTVSLDLFGSEVSTNGANYFGGGLKGRPKEESYPDHALLEGAVRVELFEDGQHRRARGRSAAGREPADAQRVREDCQAAVDKWNRVVADLGVEFRLPSERFHRGVGTFAGVFFDPDGKKISEQGVPPPRARVAAVRRRRSLRTQPDGSSGHRARQVRELDRAAGARHQRAAGRFRVRALQRGVRRQSMKYEKPCIPLGGAWSSPFVRWQGPFAERRASTSRSRSLAGRSTTASCQSRRSPSWCSVGRFHNPKSSTALRPLRRASAALRSAGR